MAIKKEMAIQKNYPGAETVSTVYFGGGTPSICSTEELQSLLEELRKHFILAEDAEITLEANPDDITAGKLQSLQQAGINRLSIGVQSFFEDDLLWMNRAHNADQAIKSLELALEFFTNITIDLIYGSPGLTDEKWKKNVDTAVKLGIPHLSCYALTVEPKTPLEKKIKRKELSPTDPDKQAEQFLCLMDWLTEAGYEHYEISNFAKPGCRSKHNSAYWAVDESGNRQKYLGLGPSAHSYSGNERQWNISNNNLYISSLANNIVPYEKEVLSPVEQLNEYIMTSLRTVEGLNTGITSQKFGIAPNDLLKKAQQYLQQGKLENKEGRLVLTRQGKLLADGIAARLFY